MELVYVVLVTVVLMQPGVVDARSRAKAKHFPACYYDSVARDNNYTACSNPLYNECGDSLCCGPDHVCCSYGGDQDNTCCRRHALSPYEITGIVTGAVAWLGNLIVIFTCITPKVARKIKRQYFKPSKVMPADMDSALEMKKRGGHF